MKCQGIRSSVLPHTTRLYADFLERFSDVRGFYAHPPDDDGLAAAARDADTPPDLRARVARVLREQNLGWGADAATRRQLDRFEAGALAVVTGQQVGLFTGPAYSLYKALTAIAVARRLSARGTQAVPVFWLATEDHDQAEINHSCWLDSAGWLRRVELDGLEPPPRRVGEIRLGQGISAALAAAAETLRGPERDAVERMLRESYTPAETFGSAFARLLTRLLAGRGLILLDPLDPRLHELAAPLYRRVLDEHAALAGALRARGTALRRAGYRVQVKVAPGSTLLFYNVDGERRPLRARSQGFAAGRAHLSSEELARALAAAPERFTANVLLRPVVQDYLLPTVAYVAGPAEVAYFAQAEVVYRHLLGRMPVIFPRAAFTLVEPRVARLLRSYALDLRDVWRGRQHLRAGMERTALPAGLARQFTEGEKALEATLRRLRRPLGRLDRTLLGALDTAGRKMLYQFLKLRGKAGRAQNLRTGVLDRHERLLLDALYPRHAPQERSLCLLGFLAAHGFALLDELESRADAGGWQHHVLYL